MVTKKKEMVRNVLRNDDTVMFYYTYIIPFYAYVMLILWWCYDYVMFLAYILIEKICDNDLLPLTQMVLQSNTGVNSEDNYLEDDEEN